MAYMHLEHLGFFVSEPISMGNWYRDNLGLRILKSSGDNEHGSVFLKDDKTGSVLEFGRRKEVPVFDYTSFDPLQVHIAFDCPDPLAAARRLISAGASLVGELPQTNAPVAIMHVKDPWGVTIQLINRVQKLDGKQ
jgi:glyoxylase I family protein